MVMEQDWVPSSAEPSGQFGPPVTHFKARMLKQSSEKDVASGWAQNPHQFHDGSSGLYIKFCFEDLTVIETTEPYEFPTLEFDIAYSEPSKSRGANAWEFLSASLRQFFPDVDGPISKLPGKIQEWKKMPHEVRRTTGKLNEDGTQEWGPKILSFWEVVAVDGVAVGGQSVGEKASSAGVATAETNALAVEIEFNMLQHLADLFDGHTIAEFNTALVASPVVKAQKGNTPGKESILELNLQDKLLDAIWAAKIVERQHDGTYKKIV